MTSRWARVGAAATGAALLASRLSGVAAAFEDGSSGAKLLAWDGHDGFGHWWDVADRHDDRGEQNSGGAQRSDDRSNQGAKQSPQAQQPARPQPQAKQDDDNRKRAEDEAGKRDDERRARDEAERQAKAERERQGKAEAGRQAKAEQERQAREHAARAEAERQKQAEADKQRRIERQRQAEPEARQEAAGQAAIEAARKRPAPAAPAEPSAAAAQPTEEPRRPIERVVIPSIGLDAPVVPAGLVERAGALSWEIPARKGGHADGTAGAGDRGNAVLLGHVDSLRSGDVFRELEKVAVGDAVTVWSGERAFIYRVVETTTVERADTSMVGTTERASLTLFTCTGVWLPTIWDYTQRFVVRAELRGVTGG